MIFGKMRLRHAASRYAALLPVWLSKNYGRHEFYTEAQLCRAIKSLNLNPRFSALAFAAYMTEPEYRKTVPTKLDADYKNMRQIFFEMVPVRADSHAINPNTETAAGLFGGNEL